MNLLNIIFTFFCYNWDEIFQDYRNNNFSNFYGSSVIIGQPNKSNKLWISTDNACCDYNDNTKLKLLDPDQEICPEICKEYEHGFEVQCLPKCDFNKLHRYVFRPGKTGVGISLESIDKPGFFITCPWSDFMQGCYLSDDFGTPEKAMDMSFGLKQPDIDANSVSGYQESGRRCSDGFDCKFFVKFESQEHDHGHFLRWNSEKQHLEMGWDGDDGFEDEMSLTWALETGSDESYKWPDRQCICPNGTAWTPYGKFDSICNVEGKHACSSCDDGFELDYGSSKCFLINSRPPKYHWGPEDGTECGAGGHIDVNLGGCMQNVCYCDDNNNGVSKYQKTFVQPWNGEIGIYCSEDVWYSTCETCNSGYKLVSNDELGRQCRHDDCMYCVPSD